VALLPWLDWAYTQVVPDVSRQAAE
jgi:hypothetical protein